jgi:nucleoid DNA-binding protein
MKKVTDRYCCNMVEKIKFKQVIRDVAIRGQIPQALSEKICNIFVETIRFGLMNGKEFTLPRLGKFWLLEAKAGLVQIPALKKGDSGSYIYKPRRYLPKFKFYNDFKKDLERNCVISCTPESTPDSDVQQLSL